jgi:hypothetical protein
VDYFKNERNGMEIHLISNEGDLSESDHERTAAGKEVKV